MQPSGSHSSYRKHHGVIEDSSPPSACELAYKCPHFLPRQPTLLFERNLLRRRSSGGNPRLGGSLSPEGPHPELRLWERACNRLLEDFAVAYADVDSLATLEP